MSDTSLIFNLFAVDRASEKILGVKSAFGKLAIGAAVAGATFAAKAVSMAGDFEAATSRLVTSAGETHQNLDLVRQGLLTMSGQVGNSAEDLARAMYTVESGGRHGAEGLQVLQAAAEGAKAEGADLTTVADALTSVLQDYHLKGSDAALITSQMVAAVGAGKTTFEQFAGSLSAILPIASSAHISFTDISAALASMTVHGMSAEQASQNLSDAVRHMTAPTMVQTKELAQLGVSSSNLSDMLGKRGLTGTMQYLSELILSHMGPSGRVMLDAFNQSKDAAANANTMISRMPKNLQNMAHEFQQNKISLGDWRKELKSLPPEQANLLSEFAALQNHASGFSDILKSGGPAAQTYQDALRRVTGDATGLNVALMLTGENTSYVNNAAKTIGAASTEAGNHVKGWADVQETFNQRLSEFKAHMSELTIKIGMGLLPVAKDLVKAFTDVVDWLTKHKTVAEALGVVVGTLAAGMLVYKGAVLVTSAAQKTAAVATGIWEAAQWLMNLALWASPITWVVAGVLLLIAVIVLIATKTTWFQTAWKYTWGFIKDYFHLIVNAIVTVAKTWWAVFSGFWRGVGHFLVAVWSEFVAETKAKWHLVTSAADAVVGFFSKLPGRISKAASGMWNGIRDGFKSAVNWIIGKWNGLSFSVPSFSFMGASVPGFNLGMPQVPYLATGGDVTKAGLAVVGEQGAEVVSLPAGSRVHPHGTGPGNGPVVIELRSSGTRLDDLLLEILRNAVRVRGGNVQVVLGR